MTIKMIHSDSGKTADVHKDEVANYKAGGYIEDKPKKKAPVKKVAK